MRNMCKALGSVLEKRVTNSSCFVSTVTRGFERETDLGWLSGKRRVYVDKRAGLFLSLSSFPLNLRPSSREREPGRERGGRACIPAE